MYYFDHEKLDVYRTALEFAGWVTKTVRGLEGDDRHPKGQLLRSSQSIVQNIAEGNGKRPGADRRRFFEIARGSALESAGTLDILVVSEARTREAIDLGKRLLVRIVEMLTKMAPPE